MAAGDLKKRYIPQYVKQIGGLANYENLSSFYLVPNKIT